MAADGVPAEVHDELERDVSLRVRGGFDPPSDIVEEVLDLHAGHAAPEALREAAQACVERALAAQRVDEARWAAPTDCDRLDAAFARLEAAGIVCRQNFSCCGTCGAGEIVDEMDDARAAGREVRGYAFFHMQDTESAVDGDGLRLNYGIAEPDDDAGEEAGALAIAREICATLTDAGLAVRWNGSWDERIGVALEWRRRRFSRPPA